MFASKNIRLMDHILDYLLDQILNYMLYHIIISLVTMALHTRMTKSHSRRSDKMKDKITF